MLPEIKTILYATSLEGDTSFKCRCRYALYLGQKTGATIHILHVAEKLSDTAMTTLQTYIQDFDNREKFLQSRLKHAGQLLEERIDRFFESLDEQERTLRSHIGKLFVVEEEPARAIIKQAEKLDANLIVMGTHHKSAAVRTFLGSVSHRVLTLSNIPTLMVPTDAK